MTNVMIDLETMATSNNAAIVAIAAVQFDIATGEIGKEFYRKVSLVDSAKSGEIDPETILWWLKQSDEAKEVFFGEQGNLLEVLTELDSWFGCVNKFKVKVWGNGSSFDNVILRNAAVKVVGKELWPFYADRDVRTIVGLGRQLLDFDPKKDMPFEGVVHNALDDAKHQAKYVSAIFRKLGAIHAD